MYIERAKNHFDLGVGSFLIQGELCWEGGDCKYLLLFELNLFHGSFQKALIFLSWVLVQYLPSPILEGDFLVMFCCRISARFFLTLEVARLRLKYHQDRGFSKFHLFHYCVKFSWWKYSSSNVGVDLKNGIYWTIGDAGIIRREQFLWMSFPGIEVILTLDKNSFRFLSRKMFHSIPGGRVCWLIPPCQRLPEYYETTFPGLHRTYHIM